MANVLTRGSKASHRYGYTSSEEMRRRTKFQKFVHKFKRNWQLHLMILIPFLYILIFEYLPMYGIQIAFRSYTIKGGLSGSPWVGLENFFRFFEDRKWYTYLGNTLNISFYRMLAGTPIPILLALILHVNEHPVLKKITQNVSYIPHFFSSVILVGILNLIFKPYNGLIASLMQMFGGNLTHDIRVDPDAFYHLYVWSGVWSEMGWSAIMYVAALAGVPMELHEAAKIDGASRWKRVLTIDIPTILPTFCILQIMSVGGILAVGHEKAFLMQYGTNISKSQIISTYVYRVGMASTNNYSFGSAVGMMQSVVSTTLVLTVNWVTDKLSEGDYALF